jgi:hypothetical protein
MTDDTNATSQSKEPETPEPAVDELPTSVIPPVETDEATQTMATEVSSDDLSTVTTMPSAEAAPAASASAPAPVYEQSGAPTEAAQPVSYPGTTPVTPTGAPTPTGNLAAFPVQGTFAPYSAQPGQFYTGQPGQPGTPVPVVKRRRRVVLWVAIVVIVILLCAGSSTLTYALTQPHSPAPNPVLSAYCQAVKSGDAQGIYNLLSQQAKVHTSLDDLQRTFEEFNTLSTLGMKYSDCAFNNIHVSGALAVATVSLTLSMSFEGQTTTITSPTLVSLVLENNQWKIDFSNFAQPLPGVSLPSLQVTVSRN